jgi:hypothetical protein
MLEPCAVKVASTVLRGALCSNAGGVLDKSVNSELGRFPGVE